MKLCGRCKAEKPIAEFNKDRYAKSGYRSQCKDCMAEERKRLRKHYKEWRSKPEIKQKYAKYRRDRYQENKKKQAARYMASRLDRPCFCESCGIQCKPEAHHCDYDKPLEVMWLCRKCHNQWHKENGEGANAS